MTDSTKSAAALVGKRVRSGFRAPWIGTAVRQDEQMPHCLWVRVDTDRCGRPLRKPVMRRLSAGWLALVDECPTKENRND